MTDRPAIVDSIPQLSDGVVPPAILGAATLVTAAMHGADIAALSAMINRSVTDDTAKMVDLSTLFLIAQRRAEALDLQREAVVTSPLLRIHRPAPGRSPLRLLALVSPGDLMANTPLDFITNDLDVRLDLLFMIPGHALPAMLPDHDAMFFAASEPDAATLARMSLLYRTWPRPMLNDPALLPNLARDRLSTLLADVCGICSPRTVEITRAQLNLATHTCRYPLLIRPIGSHAGQDLAKVDDAAGLAAYLAQSGEAAFYVSEYMEYRSADGLYRKYRVGFIEGRPYLCHMAASQHWMVHYLNAGMTESAEKRADEAEAMAQFDVQFAARHEAAFAALHELLPFDYYSLDCGELPDGRLLVFEADTAAIIHNMDSADLFPYKHVQMRRVFEAFGAMLRRRSRPVLPVLTTRQREVLELLADGSSTKDIARQLKLGLGTVKVHLGGVYQRLGARNRTEAVAHYQQSNL